MNKMSMGLLLAATMVCASGCVVTNASRLSTASESRPLVLPQDVALYRVASQIPRRYEEVALLNSSGDANYTNEAKMFESMKKEAGKVGANAVVLDALSEPGAGAKVAAAIFGVSAQRKGKALAIWVFPAEGAVAPQSAAVSAQVPQVQQPAQALQPAPPPAPAIRAFGYTGSSAIAAKAERAKSQCVDNFSTVSESEGRSIYEGTCKGGKRQLMECWSGACRTLN